MSSEESKDQVVKRALLKIQELRERLAAAERARNEPVAVIGMACRFPGGANSPELFWELLRDGRDAVTEVPPARWRIDDLFDPDPDVPGKMATRWGGFLDAEIDLFDAELFGISPREAASLDPQQRLLLEVCWEALEDAGQAVDRLTGSRTGVFVGISGNDFAQLTLFGDPGQIDVYTATGNALNAAAGRLSFVLGLQGPAMAVDTACSSSLVAVHLACRSLQNEECRMALAGGVSLILSPNPTIAVSRARMMSPEGRCKTFDAGADGYVRGEGCGLTVLKRLSDALADGDRILAVVRGSALNQDGASSGLTVPSGKAQQALIREALARAGVDSTEVGYLETHGTGTPLGDPIEVDSIKAVQAGRPAERPCVLGAVKANIGHLEAAAGVAGLIKAILALQHGEIPPQIHLRRLNPHLDLERAPFVIPLERRPWPRGESARIAGVSSFGFSGTNAHVVLGEAPVSLPATDGVERPLHLFTLSARSEEGLANLARSHALHLRAHPDLPVADAAFTANAGRAHFNHRLAVIAADTNTLCERLAASAGTTASRPRIAFLFTGQGAQYTGMGSGLFETQPTFRRALERCQELLRPHLDIPLLEVIYPQPGNDSPLDQTLYTQPALFSLQYALIELWRSWGIKPDAVLGHSVGEIAAACTAGVLRLEDALLFVAQRARLIQQLPGNGIMATVFDSEESVREILEPLAEDVSVAAVNGPAHTVISGERTAVEAVCATLQARGILVRQLQVSHAFHSPLMEPILDDIERLASTVPHHPARLRWISALTAGTADLSAGHATHWRRHLREPVRFSRSIEVLLDHAGEIFVEIGPSPTLLALGRRCLPEGTGLWLPSLRKGRDDWQQILQTLAELYVHGRDVDWNGFDRDYRRRRVALPTYPFERQHHWPRTSARASAPPRPESLPGRRIPSPLEAIQFESELSLRLLPIVGDHRISGLAWVNLVVYLEAAFAAAAEVWGDGSYLVEDLTITQGMILPEAGSLPVQMVLTPQGDNRVELQVFSLPHPGLASAWRLHARGRLSTGENAGPATVWTSRENLESGCSESLSGEQFYERVARQGVRLGPRCQWLERVWRQDGQALGLIKPFRNEAGARQRLPMSAIDACFQLLLAALPDEFASGRLLSGLGSFRFYGCPEGVPLWGAARLDTQPESPDQPLVGSLQLFTETGQVVAEAVAARLERLGREVPAEVSLRPRATDLLNELLALPLEARQGKLLDQLTRELGRILDVAPSRLDPEAPLAAQLDSLMAVELKRRIETGLGSQVPIAWFFDGKGLSQLADLLLEQLAAPDSPAEHATQGSAMTVEMMRAEAESHLDGIDPPACALAATGPPRAILLTGATGFLGAFLLHEILARTEATVYCLVRAGSPAEARERLRQNLRSYKLDAAPPDRLVPVPGDLSAPLLGLKQSEFDHLAGVIDTIHHCGAAVKWTYPYAALRSANVLGTAEVLRFATRSRLKPVHFISTVGVFASSDLAASKILESTDLERSGSLHVGYAQSKWVAEKLVTLASDRGLPVSIYRPNIGGHSVTGVFNRHDHLFQMIKGCIQMGCAPQLDFPIESAPVDYVSGAIVHLSLRPESLGRAFHLVHPDALSWNELCEWMIRSQDYPLRLVPYGEWKAELEEMVLGEEENTLRGLSPFFSESMLENAKLPRFDCRGTLAELAGTDLVCPSFLPALLQTCFSELIRSGYLASPHDEIKEPRPALT
jgi:thioester reductase-like protein